MTAVYADQAPAGARRMMMGRHMMMRGGPLGAIRMGLRQLDLTDAQRQQVRSILQSHRNEIRGLAKDVADGRRAVLNAVADGAAEDGIRAASGKLATAQANAAVAAAKIRNEVFAVLTPEQQQKAKELRSRFEQRMQQRMQRWTERQSQGGF